MADNVDYIEGESAVTYNNTEYLPVTEWSICAQRTSDNFWLGAAARILMATDSTEGAYHLCAEYSFYQFTSLSSQTLNIYKTIGDAYDSSTAVRENISVGSTTGILGTALYEDLGTFGYEVTVKTSNFLCSFFPSGRVDSNLASASYITPSESTAVPNMVTLGGDCRIIDLSQDTVTAADVLSGVTFHDSKGRSKTGTGALAYDCIVESGMGGEEPHSFEQEETSYLYIKWASGRMDTFTSDMMMGTTGTTAAGITTAVTANMPNAVDSSAPAFVSFVPYAKVQMIATTGMTMASIRTATVSSAVLAINHRCSSTFTGRWQVHANGIWSESAVTAEQVSRVEDAGVDISLGKDSTMGINAHTVSYEKYDNGILHYCASLTIPSQTLSSRYSTYNYYKEFGLPITPADRGVDGYPSFSDEPYIFMQCRGLTNFINAQELMSLYSVSTDAGTITMHKMYIWTANNSSLPETVVTVDAWGHWSDTAVTSVNS